MYLESPWKMRRVTLIIKYATTSLVLNYWWPCHGPFHLPLIRPSLVGCWINLIDRCFVTYWINPYNTGFCHIWQKELWLALERWKTLSWGMRVPWLYQKCHELSFEPSFIPQIIIKMVKRDHLLFCQIWQTRDFKG